MMGMLVQIQEAGQLLAQAEEQGFVVYLLCFLIISLAGVIIVLFNRLEARTATIFQLYAEKDRTECNLKELSNLIRNNDSAASKELMARIEVERRMHQ